MKNDNTAKANQQADCGAIFGSELRHQLDAGTGREWSEARAWREAARAGTKAAAPDESRIKGRLSSQVEAERQTRGGQVADLDEMHRTIETVKAALDASTSAAHRDRIQIAFDALTNKGRTNAKRRENRKGMLRGWRKCFRVLIADIKPDRYPFIARHYADALLKIEAELAFLGDTRMGYMHVDNVVSMLPLHVERVGHGAVVERFKNLLRQYADAYRDAALSAVDTGEFRLPALITGRDIGTGFNLNAARLQHYFPHRSYGIRASDRDQLNAEREAQGQKVRKAWKPKTRDEIRRAAGEQRDIEAMVEHYGYSRATVSGWRWSKPKPGGDMYGERFCEMLERMEDEKRLGIDPKQTASEEITPELRKALMAHFNVGEAAIRQWKRRDQLAGKVAQYRRETALAIVA